MTAIENNADVDATEAASAEASETPAVKYPTYRELLNATWKLAYRLAYVEDQFCADGANEYLESFGLPRLVHTDDNEELKDSYLASWYGFRYWDTRGELTPEEDTAARDRLARSIRRKLERNEPKSRATMSAWLTELGLEPFAPPAPPRHAGRYDISYTESNQVNSARIQEALRQVFDNLDVRVTYVNRIA